MQNYQIIVVDDPTVLKQMSAIKSNLKEEFLKENLLHLSYTEAELATRKVGISASGFPPDWINPQKMEQIAKQSTVYPIGSSLRGSPVLLMVFYDESKRAPASGGDSYGFMSLGCLMENMWLAAEALGLGVQILSLSATASIEPELKQLLGVPDELKIAYTIRLGYPAAPVNGLRVRRDTEDFVHHNRFGNKGL